MKDVYLMLLIKIKKKNLILSVFIIVKEVTFNLTLNLVVSLSNFRVVKKKTYVCVGSFLFSIINSYLSALTSVFNIVNPKL